MADSQRYPDSARAATAPFVIDTGVDTFDLRTLVPDWFRDIKPAGITVEQLFHDYGYHIIGAMSGPVKMATVRDHTLAQWRFLRELAAIHPEIFDEILCRYAERALRFE